MLREKKGRADLGKKERSKEGEKMRIENEGEKKKNRGVRIRGRECEERACTVHYTSLLAQVKVTGGSASRAVSTSESAVASAAAATAVATAPQLRPSQSAVFFLLGGSQLTHTSDEVA
jgi:hypothetical protein